MGRRSNGEGSIYKRKDGRWSGSYYDELFNRHFVYGKTQSEVRKKLKEAMKNRTVIKDDKQYTLQEWILEFMTNYKKNELKPTTYGSYMCVYRAHLENSRLGKMQLEKIRTEHLQKFYNDKIKDGYNSKTVRSIEVIINGALELAVRRRMISENPNLYTTIPKKKKYEAKTLTQTQVDMIVKEAKDEPMYPVIITTIYTGMRKGEVLGLRWEDIDFEQRKIYVKHSLCRVYPDKADKDGKYHAYYQLLEPKNKTSIRMIPMLDEVYDALQEQKRRQEKEKQMYKEIYKDDHFVFVNPCGEHFTETRFMDMYHEFQEKYGLPRIRFHDLRHTFASLLIEADTSMKLIQEILGHSNISTTMDVYGHVSDEKKVEVMENLQKRKSNEQPG